MKVPTVVLNEAICAYIDVFSPNWQGLQNYIAEQHLETSSKAITDALNALITTSEDYLWNYPGGVPWTTAFKSAFREHLLGSHSWLNSHGLDRIFVYSHWLCCHEGLNDPSFTSRVKLW